LSESPPEPPQPPVEVSASVADALVGRWVGRPRIATIDVDIELEFTRNADGTVNGKLIGTNLGEIDKPLREFAIDERTVSFTFPNVDPWSVNAELRDGSIIYKNYFDIGIAVGGGRGLVVPVMRNAEHWGLAEIERKIADFGKRAKENKLELDELTGGTFTISNGGVYGSMLSTPIINPPQSGILGLHAIQDRPVARAGQVVIRPMMYIALTYDHRIVDGREAVTFLKLVKEFIEQPARILLEV